MSRVLKLALGVSLAAMPLISGISIAAKQCKTIPGYVTTCDGTIVRTNKPESGINECWHTNRWDKKLGDDGCGNPLDKCKDVTCPKCHKCANGKCIDQCQPGESCRNGICTPPPPTDPCKAVTCKECHQCENGECINQCSECHRCENGECIDQCSECHRCENGECIDQCQPDHTCQNGACIPNLVELPPFKAEALFAPAKYQLSDDGRERLDNFSREITEKCSQVDRVDVIGYTDYRGRSSKNLILSQRRADRVRNYLIDNNEMIGDANSAAEGRGEVDPPSNNCTQYRRNKKDLKWCLRHDRRVDVFVRCVGIPQAEVQ